MDQKQPLRKEIKRRRALCPVQERQRLSVALCEVVRCHPKWQEASTVLLYHALPDEVDTTLLLETSPGDTRNNTNDASPSSRMDDVWGRRKRLLLPVVVGDDLELREYTGHTRTGAFHIEEPTGELFTDYDAIDLVLVPGMAFDRQGHRLGRGRGYYDRLLPRLSRAYRLAVCFPFQLVDEVPVENHDVLMHEILC